MPHAIYLDGDELRRIFKTNNPQQHFTREWREEQTRILQRFVAYLADQGFDVIIATVNPYQHIREEFKKSRNDVIEFFVFKCIERSREAFNASDFVAPIENCVDINTTNDSVEESFAKVLKGARLTDTVSCGSLP